LSRLVGRPNITEVVLNGKFCLALVDSGADISTVPESFVPASELQSLDVDLTVNVAGNTRLKYIGMAEVDINLRPNMSDSMHSMTILALVVPDMYCDCKVPVVLGTKLIREYSSCHQQLEANGFVDRSLPKAWKLAFSALQMADSGNGVIGTVKSTKDEVFPPETRKIIHGICRMNRHTSSIRGNQLALTEVVPEYSLPGGLLVTSCLVSVEHPSTSMCRIKVEIQNHSGKELVIPAKTRVCNLHQVQLVTNTDEDLGGSECQVNADPDFLNMFQIPDSSDGRSLKKLLLKWRDAFSLHDLDTGHTDVVTHEINLTDDTPIKLPHRRIPPHMYAEVRNHIQDMLQAGHIRPSQSPWSSPVVLVRKKDKSLRFCVDYRSLNRKTIRDAFPLPRIDETMDALCGAKYFSSLDLRAGYWQVGVKEEHKERTAFTIGPLGFYEFQSMPFGLTNSPATFQKLMHRCLGDLHKDCLVYLDDIIIFSTDLDEHMKKLEKVFERLKEYNLKLKPSKCKFLQKSVKYLGHIVSQDGIQTDPDKLQVVKSWPVPTNVKHVQQFLGFVGFYRRFIKDFAKIAHPLTRLLKHLDKVSRTKTPFCWGAEEQNAFAILKSAMVEAPVLSYADFSLPFEVHVDASLVGLGAVLCQRRDGELHVIAYASRSLKPSEMNYSAYKREFLALKWAITDKFYDYLYGATFQVWTDSNPLTYVLSSARLDATGHRWLARLSNFDFSIHYKTGKTNTDADGLSRIPEITNEVTKAVCTSSVSDEGCVSCLPMSVQAVDDLELSCKSVVESLDMKSLQRADNILSKFIDWKIRDCRPTKADLVGVSDSLARLARDWDKLQIIDDMLVRQIQHNSQRVLQLVVPSSCVSKVLHQLHDDIGHPGRDRTLALVQVRFYWPGYTRDIENYVKQCFRCMCRKAQNPKASIVPIITSRPLELVCMDYLLVEPSQGYEHLLVITDHFTKFSRVIPTKNESAKTTAKVLLESFINLYGYPERLHSDQGRNFESSLIQEICNLSGIAKSRTTPYHPQGNGSCEKFNSTLLGLLGTLAEDKKARWKDYINTLVFAYNCTPHKTTGFAPYELLFGRVPRLPIDSEFGLTALETKSVSYANYVDDLKEKIQYSQSLANANMALKADRSGQRHSRSVALNPNDRVLVRKVGLKGRHKLANLWDESIYIVVQQTNDSIPVYEVKPESGGKHRVLHRNMLLPLGSVVPPKPVPKPRKKNVLVPVAKPRKKHLLVPIHKSEFDQQTLCSDESDGTSSDEEYYVQSPDLSYSSGKSKEHHVTGVPPLDPRNVDLPISLVPSPIASLVPNPAPSVGSTVSRSSLTSPPVPVPRRSQRSRVPVDRYQAELFSLKSNLVLQLVDKILPQCTT
jgi:transposase InsO family protein